MTRRENPAKPDRSSDDVVDTSTQRASASSLDSSPAWLRLPFVTYYYLVLFLFSGFAGLVYQIVWVRQLTYILGASTYAVSIVLSTFMFGLGFGAWLIGRLSDRWSVKGLSRAYILLEVGIGCYSMMLPLILGWSEIWFAAFYREVTPGPFTFNAVRLFVSFLLLALPTTLMGGTLPVLSRMIIRDDSRLAVTVSQLYASNTFGAVLGVVGTGYFLLPYLGINATTAIAVTTNLLVAAGFWVGTRFSFDDLISIARPVQQAETVERPSITRLQGAVIVGFGLSGAAAMFYEVAWTRTLSMILGTTTYAFTTMLAVILLGIAVGSWTYRLLPRSLSRSHAFILLQLFIGASVLLTIPAFEKLPFVYLSLYSWMVESWGDMQLIRFLLAALIMLPPTLAMGALFPVVSAVFVETRDHAGTRLGTAYALNTFGAMIGACFAGLVLIPTLGMQKTILCGAVLNGLAALGAVLYLSTSFLHRFAFSAVVIVALLITSLSVSPWSPRIISSGVYVYASKYDKMQHEYSEAADNSQTIPELSPWNIWELSMKQYDLLYYNTGIAATVAVMERPDGVRFLTIDGKTDASTGEKSDMRTQVMIGHLPLLFHENSENVLVVGLGSGVTVGSTLLHDVKSVDCVEICPSVVDASLYFRDYNNKPLSDGRLNMILRDARNFLLTTRNEYDVVVSQPSNPWIRGESSLFSKDWYEIVESRLRDDGLFLQWLPSYLMAEQDLKIVMHTFRSVFPHATLWTSGSIGDLILMGKKAGELSVDYELFLAKLDNTAVYQDLTRLELKPRLIPFEHFVMNESQIGEYLYAGLNQALPLNTDNFLITEFMTPKRLVKQRKVPYFLEPDNLHGNLKGLSEIITNFDEIDLQLQGAGASSDGETAG